jgi:hypothetical protein
MDRWRIAGLVSPAKLAPSKTSPSALSIPCSRSPARCSPCARSSAHRCKSASSASRNPPRRLGHLPRRATRIPPQQAPLDTVTLDGSLPEQLVRDMIEDSHDLVVSSMPARVREQLGWNPERESRSRPRPGPSARSSRSSPLVLARSSSARKSRKSTEALFSISIEINAWPRGSARSLRHACGRRNLQDGRA